MSNVSEVQFRELLSAPPEYGANAAAIDYDGENPRYLRITDIGDNGSLLYDDVKAIPRYVAEPYILQEGEITIARTGNTVGKAYLYKKKDGEVAYAGYLIRFKIDSNKADPVFIFQFLHSPFYYSWIERTIRTGAQPNINASEYCSMLLPAFELNEQQKIAKILTTVDNLIEKTEALIEKYQAIKQGMMHDLFTRGIDTNGQLRPSHHDAPHLYKQTELGWVPNEWEGVTLDSLSTRITNGFVGVATPFYTNTEDGVMYLYGNNVRKDKLELDNVLRVTEDFHAKQRKSQLNPGDMVTVQSGHIGTTVVIPEGLGDINCHALIITKFKENAVNPYYVSYYCNSELGMLSMERLFIGSTILHINTSEFKDYCIPIPQQEEQNKVVETLTAINSKIQKEDAYLIKLSKIKKGVMQDLLTGKVRAG